MASQETPPTLLTVKACNPGSGRAEKLWAWSEEAEYAIRPTLRVATMGGGNGGTYPYGGQSPESSPAAPAAHNAYADKTRQRHCVLDGKVDIAIAAGNHEHLADTDDHQERSQRYGRRHRP